MLSLLFLIKSLIRSVMTAICQADGKTCSITGGAPCIAVSPKGRLLHSAALFIRTIMSRLFMHSLLSSISAFSFLSPPTVIHLNVFPLSGLHLCVCKKLLKSQILFIFRVVFHPETYIVELFWFHHLITSYSVQPLTIQYCLNEEPIKCILCYSSRLPGN